MGFPGLPGLVSLRSYQSENLKMALSYFGYVASENERADPFAGERDELRELLQRLQARYGRRKCFHVADVHWVARQMRPVDTVPRFCLDDVETEPGPVVREFSVKRQRR